MSALFLFFILYTSNILCSNAQPTAAPAVSTASQIYTVTQVIDTTKNYMSIVSTADMIDVLMHAFITAT